MDLNDPRRRLQVLNQSNPSLRLSVAPAQPLRVTTAPAQQLTLDPQQSGQNTIQIARDPRARTAAPTAPGLIEPTPAPSVAEQTLHFLGNAGKFAGQTAADLARPVVATSAAYGRFFGNVGNQLAGAKPQTSEEFFGKNDPLAKFAGNGKVSNLDSGRYIAGNVAQAGLYAIPGLGEIKGASLAAKAAADAGIGAAFNTAHTFANDPNATVGDYFKSAGTGAVLGAGARFGFAGLGKVKDAIAPGAKAVGLNDAAVNLIKNSDSPEEINALLSSVYGNGSDALQELSGRLATSTSKRAIIKAISALPQSAVAKTAPAADDASIQAILENGSGSNRVQALRDLEQNQAGMSTADRLAATGGDTGQAGLQMDPATRDAMLAKFRNEAASPVADLQAKLPEGYKVDDSMSVYGPDGQELTTGQIQELVQAPYLTEYEQASHRGDHATMLRIAEEHPNDKRVTSFVSPEPSTLTPEAEQVAEALPSHYPAAAPDVPPATAPLPTDTPTKVSDEAFKKEVDKALEAAGGKPAEATPQQTNDLTEAIKSNAPRVANDPAFAGNIQQAFLKTGIKDPYGLLVNALADNDKKSVTRGIVEKLLGDNPDPNTVNRLTKKLTAAKSWQEVAEIIDAETTAAKTPLPLTNTPEAATRAVESLPVQNGVTSPEIAPNGAAKVDTTPTDLGATVSQNADKAAKEISPEVTQKFPNADPDTHQAIQEVMDQLGPAARQYRTADKVRSQEKASRVAAGNAAFESAGGGEAGVRAKLGALKGRYSESGFNPITASESTQKTILDDIQSSTLRDFEKLNTQNAIRKIWGTTEGKPTPADINYIRKYFGEDMANAVNQAIEEGGKDWRERVVDVAGIPRAAMASFDLSFGGRQGLPVAARNLPEWANANKESIKYATNKEYYGKEMRKIADSDEYETINDKLGVRLPGVEGKSDEIMASANILSKVPIYGRGIDASDRAYSGGLTKLRYNLAKNWIDKLGGIDEFNAKFSDKEMKDIGEVINTFTGSGGKPGGITERHMKTLATTLFAPRLWAANLNRLNPVFYGRLSAGADAKGLAKVFGTADSARRRALEYQGSFAALAGSVLGAAAAAGATVIWDPRSADFAKIKVGNTRYDILGGQQQNIRLIAQQITGQKINSSTGELQTIGEGIKKTRAGIGIDFLVGKANPLLGFAYKQLDKKADGSNGYGEDVNTLAEVGKLLTPLNVGSIIDTAKDTGSNPKAIAMNLPGFVGFGAQTYGDVATKDKGKPNEKGIPEYTGKIEPNMVTDKNGKVMQDAKGRPITVKVPEGATAIERQALIDNKREAALGSEYKKKLSGEDQALLKRSKDELRQYVKDGTISQKKYDQLQKYQTDIKNISKKDDAPKPIPDGVKSDQATAFYEKWQTMDKKGQEKWLKAKPDDNAKSIADGVNKTRAEGLSEFKPSNALTKAYSEYEKDLNSHPEYTDIDKRNKAKAFQKTAYQLNYNDNQRDIYYEGGSSDLKTLISEGQIDKADLDQAIVMDNELYNSGVTGTLKFSKTFRKNMGYGLPDGGKGGNANVARAASQAAAKAGKTPAAPNAYLSSLLPSFKTGGGAQAPEFSSRNRGPKLKSSVNTGGSSGKKVTIKL